MSVGNGYGKIERYPMGDQAFGLEYRTEIGSSIVRLDGKVGSSVGISLGIGDGNLEGPTLGEK